MKTHELKQKVQHLTDLESRIGDIKAVLAEAQEFPNNFEARLNFKSLRCSYSVQVEFPHELTKELRDELFCLETQAEVLHKELGVTE